MNSDGVVDLYGLRCAVAVLVHARHDPYALTDSQVRRLDAAVRYLADSVTALNGELASQTTTLLAPDPDPGGQRTVRAIDRLAELTHVERTAAPALAASLRASGRAVQGRLFDDDSPMVERAQ